MTRRGINRGRERRRQRADIVTALAMLRSGRSDAAQLALLIQRGHGHCKEAKRLAAKASTTN